MERLRNTNEQVVGVVDHMISDITMNIYRERYGTYTVLQMLQRLEHYLLKYD